MKLADIIRAMGPVAIKEFCFNNSQGGTIVPRYDPQYNFSGKAEVNVVRGWYDYETGYRFVGRAANQELKDHLAKHSHDSDVNVYFSEFDVVDAAALNKLKGMADIAAREQEARHDARADSAEEIRAWCEQHGFGFDEEYYGVICEAGERIVFEITHERGDANVAPAGFDSRHNGIFGFGDDTFTLFQDFEEPIQDFLTRIEVSMAQASQGLDLNGNPYDYDAVQTVANGGFRGQKSPSAKRASP